MSNEMKMRKMKAWRRLALNGVSAGYPVKAQWRSNEENLSYLESQCNGAESA
jgi:hypothetical protein